MPVPSLPTELEKEIFQLGASHTNAHHYLLVAQRVRIWLEPLVYRDVNLLRECQAFLFLKSISSRAAFARTAVKILHLAAVVRIKDGAAILELCQGVEDLTIRIAGHLAKKNRLWDPMSTLPLHSLSADFAAITDRDIKIPLFQMTSLQNVTHLNLTNAWRVAQSQDVMGLENLAQITHLSLSFSYCYLQTEMLKMFLERKTFVTLVLWKSMFDIVRYHGIALQARNLLDKWIVILECNYYGDYMAAGGFWKYVKRLVEWWSQSDEIEAMDSPLDIVLPYRVQRRLGIALRHLSF